MVNNNDQQGRSDVLDRYQQSDNTKDEVLTRNDSGSEKKGFVINDTRRGLLKKTALGLTVSGSGLSLTSESVSAAPVQISNDQLTVFVDDMTGRFRMETAGGQPILYPHSFTSFLTVRVDGDSYVTDPGEPDGSTDMQQYLSRGPSVTEDGRAILTEWELPAVRIRRTIRLQGEAAMFELIVENTDNQSHDVDVRYLFDYQVGPQDGAPIFVNGDVLTTEARYESPTFETWQTYDQLPEPDLTGQGIVETNPDRIEFVAWEDAVGSSYNYEGFDPNKDFYTPGSDSSPQSDSAGLLYWELGTVDTRTETSVTTYYGTGEPSERELSDLETALGSLEEAVEKYINQTRRARANSYAGMYKHFGTQFSSDLVNYWGYLAGEVPETHVDDEFRETHDTWIADDREEIEGSEIATEIYWFHEELFAELSPSMSESEMVQTVYEFLMGTHPDQNHFIRIDGQTFAEFRNELVSDISNQRETILQTVSAQTGIDAAVIDDIIECIAREARKLDSYREEFVKEVESMIEITTQDTSDETDERITGYISPLQSDEATQERLRPPAGGLAESRFSHGSRSRIESSSQFGLGILTASGIALGMLGVLKGAAGTAAGAVISTKGLAYIGGGLALGGSAVYVSSSTSSTVAGTTIVGRGDALNAARLAHSAYYYNLYYSTLATLDEIGRQVQSFALRQLKQELREKLKELVNKVANEALQEVVEELCKQNQTIQEVNVSDIGTIDTITTGSGLNEARQSGSIEIKNTGNQTIIPHLDRSYITSQDRPGNETPVGHIQVNPEELTAIDPGETTTIEFSYTMPVGFLCGRYKINFIVDAFVVDGATFAPVAREFAFFEATGLAPCIDNLNIDILNRGTIFEGDAETYDTEADEREMRDTYTLSYGGSDLDLHVYDSQGNHVGQNYDTGEFETEIQGAEYSGPDRGDGVEGVELPPEVSADQVDVVAVEAPDDGVEYIIDVTSVPHSPAELHVFPNRRTINAISGESGESHIAIEEVAGFESLSNVELTADSLVRQNDDSHIPESAIEFSRSGFDVDPDGTEIIDVTVSVPAETPAGTYSGEITVRADGGITETVDIELMVRSGQAQQTLMITGNSPVEYTLAVDGNINVQTTAGDFSAEDSDTLTQNNDGTWTTTDKTGPIPENADANTFLGDRFLFTGSVTELDLSSAGGTTVNLYLDERLVSREDVLNVEDTSGVHTLMITANGPVEYALTVDGDLDVQTTAGDFSAEDGDTPTQNNDGTWTATDETGPIPENADANTFLGDRFLFTGSVTELDLSPASDATDVNLYLNERQVTREDILSNSDDHDTTSSNTQNDNNDSQNMNDSGNTMAADDSMEMPGFGIGGAIASVGGAAYLLKRFVTDTTADTDD